MKNSNKYIKMLNSKLVLIILFFFVFASNLFSGNRDTIASLIIDEIAPLNSYAMNFSIRLLRHSDVWSSYANGTYQITFDDPSYKFNKLFDSVRFTGRTDLKIFNGIDMSMPIDGYGFDCSIHDSGRISIMIAGPEKFIDAKLVPKDDKGILIGEFQVFTTDSSKALPEGLLWMEPYHLYQACAYKLAEDSLLAQNVVWNYKDSNVELFDSLNADVKYTYRKMPKPDFVLDYFNAVYEGKKMIGLNWKTSSEAFSEGMTIKRGIRSMYSQKIEEVEYNEVIATYNDAADPYSKLMRGTGIAGKGSTYYIPDIAPIRGAEYCYELAFRKKDKLGVRDSILARSCVTVPNAVIYQATAAPNPFRETTQIMFWVEDDVTLSAYVRDVDGREIDVLCKDVEYKQNLKMPPHVLNFSGEKLATAGLYEVLLVAKPINDDTITQSTASIKIQLIR